MEKKSQREDKSATTRVQRSAAAEGLVTLDLGTSVVKAALWNLSGEVLATSESPAPQLQIAGPKVEQDLQQYLDCIAMVLRELKDQAPSSRWHTLAITSQRGTLLLADAQGAPLTPLISWMDQRGELVNGSRLAYLKQGDAALASKIGGLFSLNSWLVHKLTGEFFDTTQTAPPEYDLSLHSEAHAYRPIQMVPVGTLLKAKISDSSLAFLDNDLNIVLAGGDKNCEMLGALTDLHEQALLSMGTATSLGLLLLATERRAVQSLGFVTDAWLPELVHFETGIPAGGKGFEWLTQTLRGDFSEHREWPLPTADSPFFVPFLAGSLGHRNERGMIAGLSLTHRPAEIVAAWIEGGLFELKANLLPLLAFRPAPTVIVMTGGGAANISLGQWAADLFDCPVLALSGSEAGLIGAARVAAVSSGLMPDFAAAAQCFMAAMPKQKTNRASLTYKPNRAGAALWQRRFARYRQLVAGQRQLVSLPDSANS